MLNLVPAHPMPSWNPGQQIVNLGTGGPASHMGLQAQQPRTYPTIYGVGVYGMRGAMPRQVIGVTNPVYVNALSNPNAAANLVINGLSKSGIGG